MCMLQNKIFGLLSLFTLLVSILLIPLYNIIILDLPSIGKVNNCPLCFGRELCSCLNRENFTLNWDHFLINVLSIGSRKNHIIFGKCGEDLIVVKNRRIDFSQNKVNFSRVVDFNGFLESLEQTSLKQLFDIHKKYTYCYSYRKLVTHFFENVAKKENNVSEVYLNLFFIALTNMEPIIQQVVKDWAVAEYLGSCGDFTVSRYCGYTLTWVMPQLNWTTRSSVAVQLLQFAFNATFSHPQFAFYFTDMSPDNFAVSADGKIFQKIGKSNIKVFMMNQ
uniref:FAM69 protein-kinase domain-containing protein n=1 Tax=Cuerna arida TaxID=1464854 RepID=A0A1B6EJF5_9HEMI